MENLVYVTGNFGKYTSVKEYAEKENINIKFFKHDFEEPEINDIEIISKKKALDAYNLLGKPCFAEDTGFYIEDYPNNPGYPGAFVKRSGISANIDHLLEVMKNQENRNCKFIHCLTFYDGEEFYTFYEISKGSLSFEKKGKATKKAKSNLWYVFIPKGNTKTLAEMNDEERKKSHSSVTITFINWYKNTYLKNRPIQLKLTSKK